MTTEPGKMHPISTDLYALTAGPTDFFAQAIVTGVIVAANGYLSLRAGQQISVLVLPVQTNINHDSENIGVSLDGINIAIGDTITGEGGYISHQSKLIPPEARLPAETSIIFVHTLHRTS